MSDFDFLGRGRNAGLKYNYLTAVSDTDPDDGNLKFDQADLRLVNKLLIADLDRDGNDDGPYIGGWDASTTLNPKGHIFMRQETAPEEVAVFKIVGFNEDTNLLSPIDPKTNGAVHAVAIQSDGKIIIAGDFTTVSPNGGGPVTRNRIARFNANGTLDTGFNPNVNAIIQALAVQDDGAVIIGGDFTDIGGGTTRTRLARLDVTTGAPDSWDPNVDGTVYAILIDDDGQIVIGGAFRNVGSDARNRAARVDPTTGVADSWNPAADGDVFALAIQDDDKILAGGTFANIGGQPRNRLARLHPVTGVADAFDPDPDGQINAIAVQEDGQILVGGEFGEIGDRIRANIARLDVTTGLADLFGPDTDFAVNAIVLQQDGKILVGGEFSIIAGETRRRIARLDPSSGLADSFNPNVDPLVAPPGSTVYAIAVRGNDDVSIGGAFAEVEATTRNNFALLASTYHKLQVEYVSGPTSFDNNTFVMVEWTRTGNKGVGAGVWGGITGLLSDQTDLQAALNARGVWGNITGTLSDQSDLAAALAARVLYTDVDVATTALKIVKRDTNANLNVNNANQAMNVITAAGGISNLTVASAYIQVITGTATQTLQLPVASTLVGGVSFRILNLSTQKCSIKTSGGSELFILGVNQWTIVTCINPSGGTGVASWTNTTNVRRPEYVQDLRPASDSTIAAATTMVLDGLGYQIDVTGTANIATMTLAAGEERSVRFLSTPTIIASSTLIPIAGVTLGVIGGSWCLLRGETGGVTRMIEYQDDFGFPVKRFHEVLTGKLKPLNPTESLWMDFSAGDSKLVWSGSSGNIIFDMGLVSTSRVWEMPDRTGSMPVIETDFANVYPYFHSAAFVHRSFEYPDQSGTFSLVAGVETLTNKSIDASQLTGAIAAARMPALTGDVTSPLGSAATTISAGVVTFAKMATAAWSDDVTLASDSSTAFPTIHAAKTYADNLKAGLKFKVDCRVASTANVNIASAPSSVDGTTLASLDRVLLKNQSTASQNGPYQFNGAGVAMTRTTDGDTGAKLVSATFPIREGTANQDTWWTITNDAITIGSTSIVFTQTGGAGTYTNGLGLTLTGNSFSITTGGVTLGMLDASSVIENDPDMIRDFPGGKLTTSQAINSYVNDTINLNANGFLQNGGTGYTLLTPVFTGLPSGSGVSAGAVASTLAARDANANLTVNSLVESYTTTATAAGTTTLTIASTYLQYFSGATTQTVKLPVANTLVTGQQFMVVNLSTGAVTVQSSGANTIKVVAAGTSAVFTCILASGTGTASWDTLYFGVSVSSGKKASFTNTVTFSGTDGTTMTFPTTSATLARIDASNTFAEAADFVLGTTTGSKIGTATAQKLAFHNSTPVIQRAGAAQVAVVTTAATNVAPFGFATAGQADALVTLVNELRATLVEKGLMKGAA